MRRNRYAQGSPSEPPAQAPPVAAPAAPAARTVVAAPAAVPGTRLARELREAFPEVNVFYLVTTGNGLSALAADYTAARGLIDAGDPGTVRAAMRAKAAYLRAAAAATTAVSS